MSLEIRAKHSYSKIKEKWKILFSLWSMYIPKNLPDGTSSHCIYFWTISTQFNLERVFIYLFIYFESLIHLINTMLDKTCGVPKYLKLYHRASSMISTHTFWYESVSHETAEHIHLKIQFFPNLTLFVDVFCIFFSFSPFLFYSRLM